MPTTDMPRTQRTILPVPYPDCLIVGGRQDPWELVVEENGADVVKVAVEREKAATCLVRPNLDLVVIATGDEQGLSLVKVDASNGSIVLFESVDQRAHSIVPKLDSR